MNWNNEQKEIFLVGIKVIIHELKFYALEIYWK